MLWAVAKIFWHLVIIYCVYVAIFYFRRCFSALPPCGPGEFDISPNTSPICKPCYCFGVTDLCYSSDLEFGEASINCFFFWFTVHKTCHIKRKEESVARFFPQHLSVLKIFFLPPVLPSTPHQNTKVNILYLEKNSYLAFGPRLLACDPLPSSCMEKLLVWKSFVCIVLFCMQNSCMQKLLVWKSFVCIVLFCMQNSCMQKLLVWKNFGYDSLWFR